jgi:hypothetical protein
VIRAGDASPNAAVDRATAGAGIDDDGFDLPGSGAMAFKDGGPGPADRDRRARR